MKKLYALALVIIAGCSDTFDPRPEVEYKRLDDALTLILIPSEDPCGFGDADACVNLPVCNWDLRVCEIQIKPDIWLDCIAHEARHANEGFWHGDRKVLCTEYGARKI